MMSKINTCKVDFEPGFKRSTGNLKTLYFKKLRVRFLVWRHRKTFKKIEDALGFTLYDWQKLYIAGDDLSVVPCKRGNGKTLAHILKAILAFDLKDSELKRKIYDKDIVTDAKVEGWCNPNTKHYEQTYRQELKHIYKRLLGKKIRHRIILFY